MKKLAMAVGMSLLWMSVGAVAQEHKHEEHKEEQKAPAKKNPEPAKSESMKCCEGMEKMGGQNADMPMKSGMTPEMKAKMIEKMKAKMADKAAEKQSSDVPAKGQAEKSQPNKEADQH